MIHRELGEIKESLLSSTYVPKLRTVPAAVRGAIVFDTTRQ
jgi:hypothetical protein